MKLEQQVATLEQSKKLKELGIGFESLFSYSWDWLCQPESDSILILTDVVARSWCSYPAPTAEEIAELLPANFCIGSREYNWEISKGGGDKYYKLRCQQYFAYGPPALLKEFINKSLTQALASMLIWLIENNHINSEELNGK